MGIPIRVAPAIRLLRQPLFANALFLALNSGVGALGGLGFWAVTARIYTSEAVGLGSATLAAITLIGTIANLGYRVRGVDGDHTKVEQLNSGHAPVYEPGIEALLAEHLASGMLSYTSDLRRGAAGADFVIVAIDTPVDEEDHVDLTPLDDAVLELAKWVEPEATVIVSSQVPVGTCDRLAALLH